MLSSRQPIQARRFVNNDRKRYEPVRPIKKEMSMTMPQHLQKIIDILWQSVEKESPGNVYTILDAARDVLIYPEIQGAHFDIKSACLYEGEQARELADVAPYLVQLQKDEAFTHWLFSNGWGKSWGIFLVSKGNFEAVLRHFRQFVFVRDEKGKNVYFRFYDPRVLRSFLPTCRLEEAKEFFGPVNFFFMENEDADQLVKFSCSKTGVEKEIVNTNLLGFATLNPTYKVCSNS